MENRNGAFRRAEGALREATSNIKDRLQANTMREPSKPHPAMGGMKDALRDQPKRSTH